MAVYSALKMFQFPEKLQSLPRNQPIMAPVHIRMKPTNACNHRCRYCAYLDANMQLGKDMCVKDSIPRDKMLELCKDIVQMGVKAVTFSGGGEPFMYPHLIEGASILAAGGVSIASLTNGGRLAGEAAEFMAHNAVWIRVSMDGWDDESYVHYRGVSLGEYTRIMNNIENFMKLGGTCTLGVSYIVDANNCSHIPQVLRRYKDIGVRSVKVSACITSNDAKEVNAYHAPHFEQTEASIIEAASQLQDDSFEIVNAWHKLDGRFHKNYDWCPFSQVLAVIGADLGVYPCQDKAYNNDALLGSLKNTSLMQWWASNKDAFFKLRPCEHCQHHCVANAKNEMILEYLNLDPRHGAFV